nr:hypothetical protein [Nonlabens ulvanivorans]
MSTYGYVDSGEFNSFRPMALSFISNLFGKNHPYYKEFKDNVNDSYEYNIQSGISILESIKFEIENGWLVDLKKLVSAEVFSDFLEMSKYLLDEKYKDPAAVMIGSVLEEHLRQLCKQNKIDTVIQKPKKTIHKKADQMNIELCKAGAYGMLEQKSVTFWLDLRNKAAHGKYSEYTIEQVNLMHQGVLDFIVRTK